jgi:dTDP-4-dehydrorhamnose 3,5-epimerase
MIATNNFEKFNDDRGCFYEIPNISNEEILQYSVSVSKKNVLRGLHYQYSPPMGKQINIIKGSILDCIVDLRRNSEFYGMHKMVYCSETDNNSLYIPPGFAHGFLSLEEDTTILYFQTSVYNKQGESGINPLDKTLNINWGLNKEDFIISEKDTKAKSFTEFTDTDFNWRIK